MCRLTCSWVALITASAQLPAGSRPTQLLTKHPLSTDSTSCPVFLTGQRILNAAQALLSLQKWAGVERAREEPQGPHI